MGTNYYVKAPTECGHCGGKHICKQAIHIGKSSMGWQFTFAYNEGVFYKNLEEMKEWSRDKQIYDEYNRLMSFAKFWKMVESKMKFKSHIDHNLEHGESPDAYGHIIDGIYFMDGEFS